MHATQHLSRHPVTGQQHSSIGLQTSEQQRTRWRDAEAALKTALPLPNHGNPGAAALATECPHVHAGPRSAGQYGTHRAGHDAQLLGPGALRARHQPARTCTPPRTPSRSRQTTAGAAHSGSRANKPQGAAAPAPTSHRARLPPPSRRRPRCRRPCRTPSRACRRTCRRGSR
jgi:hypothetical protein